MLYSPTKPRPRRRAITSVLAMMFVVLFAVMALGFYAQMTTAVQVAGNEQDVERAMLATQSGVNFMTYHLGNVTIPGGTTSAQLLSQLNTQLGARLNGQLNLHGATVSLNGAGDTITVPSINADSSGSSFRATIQKVSAQRARVKVVGQYGSSGAGSSMRAVQLEYKIAMDSSDTVLGFGFATKGSLSLSGGFIRGSPTASLGSLMSASITAAKPLSMSGSTVIDGSVSFVNSIATINGSGSIGGTTNPALWPVTTGITAPKFPAVDTSPFVQYLVGKETLITSAPASGATLSNIRVRAGTNINFGGGCTLKGVIVIEMPNKVTFSGGPHIQGVIVVDDVNNTNTNNEIIISGAGLLEGPGVLDSSYGDLRNMGGASILAPNCKLTMTGGSSSIGGTVVGKSLLMSGGGAGSVNGSIILTADTTSTFSGGAGVTITSSGASGVPTGLVFDGEFAPVYNTYLEVSP